MPAGTVYVVEANQPRFGHHTVHNISGGERDQHRAAARGHQLHSSAIVRAQPVLPGDFLGGLRAARSQGVFKSDHDVALPVGGETRCHYFHAAVGVVESLEQKAVGSLQLGVVAGIGGGDGERVGNRSGLRRRRRIRGLHRKSRGARGPGGHTADRGEKAVGRSSQLQSNRKRAGGDREVHRRNRTGRGNQLGVRRADRSGGQRSRSQRNLGLRRRRRGQQEQPANYDEKMRYESLGKIRHNGLHPSTASPLLCPIRRPNCSRRMYGLSNELIRILVSNRRIPARGFVQQAAPREQGVRPAGGTQAGPRLDEDTSNVIIIFW